MKTKKISQAISGILFWPMVLFADIAAQAGKFWLILIFFLAGYGYVKFVNWAWEGAPEEEV